MDINSLIASLKEKGYSAMAHDVIESSTVKHGISIQEHYSSPCLYVEELIQNNPSMKTEDLATEIINLYEVKKDIKTPIVPTRLVTSQNQTLSSSVKEWALKLGVSRLILLPTDAQEMILFPVDDVELDVEYLSKSSSRTHNTQMHLEEQLNPKAYLLHIGVE